MLTATAKIKPITRISQLVPDDKNANLGTERGNAFIERSIREYGLGRSILIDKNGCIIAGNKTVENAGAVGIEEVQVIQTDGRKIIAVQRMDLDMAKDPKARELALADNRSGELNLEWAGDVLAEMGKEIDLKPFFSASELAAIVSKDATYGDVPDPQIEKADQLRKKWEVKTGQFWEISRDDGTGPKHRLLCGDSTIQADVSRMWANVADDALPCLMVTDPPYGVGYEPEWRNEALGEGNRATGKVANDDRIDWSAAYILFPGDVAYVWHAARYASEVQDSLMNSGFVIRCQIIWAKQHFAISRGHYHWQHEPWWYAVKANKTARWLGDHAQSTLWEINNNLSQDGGRPEKATGHGTQKPIECMRRPIVNHEGNVYDPFLGSGTTMCAAEQVGRSCFGVELEPNYVGVILERISAMGLTPKLVA